MSDVEEDVLLSLSSVAKLQDVGSENNGERIDVVETCHVELNVVKPPSTLDVVNNENETEETNTNDTELKRLVTEPKIESTVVKINEKDIDLAIDTKTLIQNVTDKTVEKDNDKIILVDKPKSKQPKPSKGNKGKQRKRKSSCCCCCRGGSRDDDDVTDQDDRNGIRVVINNDNLDEIDGGDKTIPEIKTFQQDTIESTEPTRRQKCGRKCVKCCKKFLTFLFSNVGLCSAVVAYSILGGFIFQKLEAPNEIQKRHFVTSLRKGYAKDLWKLTEDRFILFENNFTYEAEKILRYYQNDVLEAKKNGWDGAESNMEVEPQWSFAGSLLYSVTVITTIGYGHIAPKTTNGRLVTIFYALIGIPLTLLCLANMGGFLGNGFRLFYKHTCRLCTWLCCPPEESFSQKKISMPKSRSKSSQEITLLHKQEDQSGNTLAVLPPSSPKLRKISRSRSRSSSPTATGSDINIVIEDYDHRQSKPKEKKTEHIRVPIFVSLLIITLYVFGGALMFSMWEPWSHLEGSYFCFITLSTIGFGDYVPGSISRVDSADSRQKLIICCVYLMFGLSVLAMCFDLMQEDVRGKFLWLGQKMGLVDRRR